MLECIQHQLTRIIYPLIESAPTSVSSAVTNSQNILQHLLTNSSTAAHRHTLSEIFQSLLNCIPRITRLLASASITMSDTIVIQAVYISIGPFFVTEQGVGSDTSKGKKDREDVISKTFGKSAMHGLRLDALGLIRTVRFQTCTYAVH